MGLFGRLNLTKMTTIEIVVLAWGAVALLAFALWHVFISGGAE